MKSAVLMQIFALSAMRGRKGCAKTVALNLSVPPKTQKTY